MDDENKQEPQNNTEAGSESQQTGSGPRVHIFGAEVNGGGDSAGGDGSGGGNWSKHSSETKEEWRRRKEEWKQNHRQHMQENKEQWKAQRRAWRDEHHYGGGGLFWGMVVLFAGVIGLLYTMGFVSHSFWQAIIPFWPILLILWGASIILGRHWFARFILFILALTILIIIIFYGLARTGSPVVSWLSPNVVRAVQTTQPPQY